MACRPGASDGGTETASRARGCGGDARGAAVVTARGARAGRTTREMAGGEGYGEEFERGKVEGSSSGWEEVDKGRSGCGIAVRTSMERLDRDVGRVRRDSEVGRG